MSRVGLYWGPLQKRRNPASAKRRRDFDRAFFTELRRDRNTPPGPLALATAMGWSSRQLPGWASKRRAYLLRRTGFRKDEYLNRWRKS